MQQSIIPFFFPLPLENTPSFHFLRDLIAFPLLLSAATFFMLWTPPLLFSAWLPSLKIFLLSQCTASLRSCEQSCPLSEGRYFTLSVGGKKMCHMCMDYISRAFQPYSFPLSSHKVFAKHMVTTQQTESKVTLSISWTCVSALM